VYVDDIMLCFHAKGNSGHSALAVSLNTAGHYRTKYHKTAQNTAWQPQDSIGHYTRQPDENNRRVSIDKTNKAKESVGLSQVLEWLLR